MLTTEKCEKLCLNKTQNLYVSMKQESKKTKNQTSLTKNHIETIDITQI